MQRVQSISVMQQAVLCIALGLVSSTAWFVEPLTRDYSGHTRTLWFMLFAAPVFATVITSYWIGYDLRNGIESERWPEEQIKRFRATFNSPLSVGVYVTLTIVTFLFLILDVMSAHHAYGSGYGLLLLLQNFSQLKMAARPPKAHSPVERIDWHSATPITSEHWGQHN
jgi:hypothetical protein